MEASNKRAIFVSLSVNVGISLIKFLAAAVTGSAAMLAEAIHTFADTSHELFLLLGVHQAKAPADERFPYGQGKAVYFWGFVAVVVFLLGGLLTIDDAIQQLRHPAPIAWAIVACIVLAISMVLNGVALREALKQFMRSEGGRTSFVDSFRNTKDPSMQLLIIQNSLDVLGEGLAFFAILLSRLTGNYRLDALASIVVGLMLVGSALWQASRIKNLLIGHRAGDDVVQGIRDLVHRQGAVCEIEELTTLHMGPEYVLVNLRVRFADNLFVEDVEGLSFFLERQIEESFPIAKRVYVRPVMPSTGLLFRDALFTWPTPAPVKERVE
jgi:cation diffusion facilitator family transporter